MVTAEFGIKEEDILIYYTGPVIGAHSGPGTLALFFVANER
jgi:fatty acid-binding protein DegV